MAETKTKAERHQSEYNVLEAKRRNLSASNQDEKEAEQEARVALRGMAEAANFKERLEIAKSLAVKERAVPRAERKRLRTCPGHQAT